MALVCALAGGAASAQNPVTAVYPAAVADDDDLLCWGNNAQTQLSAQLSASATTIAVWDSSGFCAPSTVVIGSEVIKISAVSAGTLTVASGGRGYDGTTAAVHYNSAPVKGYVPARWFHQAAAEIKAIQTTLGADLEELTQVPAGGTTAQYLRGDNSWQTLDTTAVAEGTGLYFTEARARGAISAGTNVAYDSGTGVVSVTSFPWASLSGVPSTFTPSAHAASHQFGGGDALSLAGLAVAWGDLTSVPATFAPTAHAASHGDGGADEVTITEAQISDLAHFDGAYASLSGIPSTFAPTAHATAHQSGGGDQMSLAGLAVAWADLTSVPSTFTPTAHATSHQFGGGDVLSLAGLAVAWADLTSVPATFAPSAHAASHADGGADEVTITEAQISDLAHFDGAYGSLSGVPSTFAPLAHAAAHQSGGGDQMSLAGLAVAWADLTSVPATFAPSAHATSHQFGGGDVLSLAGLAVAWGDLTSVPATFAPSSHAASHADGGADEVTITEAQISDLAHFDGAYGSLSGVPSTFAPTAHASAHQSGGGDALDLASLAGTLGTGQAASAFVLEGESPAAGDVTGTFAAGLAVSDDSHAHTSSTISGLDAANDISSGLMALARGGLNADLSATGGAGYVLKQVSAGAAVTVGALDYDDLANKPTFMAALYFDGSTDGYTAIPFPAAVTITAIRCETSGSGATFDLDATESASASSAGTAVTSSTLVCDFDQQVTTSFTDADIAAGNRLHLALADSTNTPDWTLIQVFYELQ